VVETQRDWIADSRIRHFLKAWQSRALLLLSLSLIGCSEQTRPPEVSRPNTEPGSQQFPRDGEIAASEVNSGTAVNSDEAASSVSEHARLEAIYVRDCRDCHGGNGDGNGPAARFLSPKPRDFRSGKFRLVTTRTGIPTIQDLVAVLTRGMPGSSMPPWPKLSQHDRQSLARRVLRFRRQAVSDREQQLATEIGELLNPEALSDLVDDLMTPGPSIDVPRMPKTTVESIEQGRELYLTRGCASCHGQRGRGNGTQKQVDAKGRPTRSRDLTKGIFKGLPDPKSVYIRTQAGMPGTPMPRAVNLTHDQITDLVHFVLSLSDGPTRSAQLLTYNNILARHVGKVPQSLSDRVWSRLRPVRIRLMPLWWRDDHVETVAIRAVHDGTTLALHLSWQDAVMNARAVRTEEFSDAAAVQFSADDQPPFLGMGSRQSQVSVWYWRADHATDSILAGIDTAFPDMIVNFYPFQKPPLTGVLGRGGAIDQQDPYFIAGVGSNNPVSELRPPHSTQNLAATGFGTLTAGHRPRERIGGKSEWNSGRWQLMLSRDLRAIAGQEIALEPGRSVSVSFAIWEGDARDRGPRKQVSIWQTLTLEQPGHGTLPDADPALTR